ncbi:MAG: phosphohydrolase [Mitsuaria chitosanitabida]|uniref:HD-GYP domain-containing protein n=1 Tax=Roseateles chitosanitabidus TaxID=65048 RepID=UPI001B250BBD|nr:phosphohydrolase [Roseateles chitosanitabidus]MBO9688413.1 phosphohydrolase [Roseateles chitosanitabidus]
MELVQLPPHSLRVGQVLSFSLRDAAGHLLFASGHPLPDTPQVRDLIARGPFVFAHETREYQRALAHKLDTMVLQGASMSELAKAKPDFRLAEPAKLPLRAGPAHSAIWADLQWHAQQVLRDPTRPDFLVRLTQLLDTTLSRLDQQPDASLALLIHDAGQEPLDYSARHALLSLALCELTTRQLGWSDGRRRALGLAALTMNLGITRQQDEHALRAEPLSAEQREQLAGHGDRAATQLLAIGVEDEAWLAAVRLHHDAGPGPLAGRSDGELMARLLRRVDIYGARISPRRNRRALSAAQAARAVYLDESQQPDEAGAALIKAIGLYPPGSLVRLSSGEEGMVLKRGHSANEPMVAALVGRSGTPLTAPVLRDTRLPAQAISASLAPHEIRLRIHMDAMLKLY